MFTLRDKIYSLARHHHRRCTPKFGFLFEEPKSQHFSSSYELISKNKCRCAPRGTRTLTLSHQILNLARLPVTTSGQLQGYSCSRQPKKATRNFMRTSRLPCNLKEIRFIAFSPTKLSPNSRRSSIPDKQHHPQVLFDLDDLVPLSTLKIFIASGPLH